MTKPKKPKIPQKSKALYARVTAAEFAATEQVAWSQGVRIGAFILEAVRDAVRKAGGKVSR